MGGLNQLGNRLQASKVLRRSAIEECERRKNSSYPLSG